VLGRGDAHGTRRSIARGADGHQPGRDVLQSGAQGTQQRLARFRPYSPLGHGFLTGTNRSPDELSADDWRKTNPRFTGENFQRNLRIVAEVEAVAAEARATPAQIALAWLLAQGDDIAPIPGTKRVARVEENTAADSVELSARQIARLDKLTPAAGERHDEGNMAVIDR